MTNSCGILLDMTIAHLSKKMNREHKYRDNDAERITESLREAFKNVLADFVR